MYFAHTIGLMATQDDYLKTALRLPRDLHARLLKAARDSSKSLNAEIVTRLEASFGRAEMEEIAADLAARLDELHDDVKAIRQTVGTGGKKQGK